MQCRGGQCEGQSAPPVFGQSPRPGSGPGASVPARIGAPLGGFALLKPDGGTPDPWETERCALYRSALETAIPPARSMDKQVTHNYADVSIAEAAARRARVDLVLRPVRPSAESWLFSKFLATHGTDGLVLSPPWDRRGNKVILPEGWPLGIAFDLGDNWFQARTKVLQRCFYPLQPTRRVDAVLVQRPREVLCTGRRRRPRQQVAPSRMVLATVWFQDCVEAQDFRVPLVGRLENWSEAGLGVLLDRSPQREVGDRAVIRLEKPRMDECLFLWAVLMHATRLADGAWLAGFGDPADVSPGEATGLMEFLAGTGSYE